jgi:hypothetical protein
LMEQKLVEVNGSDFRWKGGLKTRKIYGKTLKSPLDTLKKHQNNRSYLEEVFLMLNGSACKQGRYKLDSFCKLEVG